MKPIEFDQSMFDEGNRTIRRSIKSKWDNLNSIEIFFREKQPYINMKSKHTGQIKSFNYVKRIFGNEFWFRNHTLDVILILCVELPS